MELYLPEWRGEPLDSKRLLVMQGGGFVDNMMFFRFLGEAKKLGAHVTYACPEQMIEMFDGHPSVDKLIPTHEGPKTDMLSEFDAHIKKDGVMQYDYFIPIMGMPRILKTTVAIDATSQLGSCPAHLNSAAPLSASPCPTF
jgi:hypothetical protein